MGRHIKDLVEQLAAPEEERLRDGFDLLDEEAEELVALEEELYDVAYEDQDPGFDLHPGDDEEGFEGDS